MGVGRYPATLHPRGASSFRQLAPIGGSASWVSDDVAVYSCEEGPADKPTRTWVETFDLVSGQRTEVAAFGANEIAAAAGGSWLAWRDHVGVFGQLAEALPAGAGLALAGTDGRSAAGPDGSQAYVLDRQNGTELVLRHPDGRQLSLPNALDLHILGFGQAVWLRGDGSLGSLGLGALGALPGARGCRAAWLAGRLWLVYWASDALGLVAHPNGDLSAVRFIETGPAFNHDAVVVDGKLVVAYSATTGERPEDFRACYDVEALPARDLSPTAPPPAPASSGALAAFSSKMFVAPFHSFRLIDLDTENPKPDDANIDDYRRYANAIIAARVDMPRVYGFGMPIIAYDDVGPQFSGSVVAYWQSAPSFARLEPGVRAALGWEEKPVLAYIDSKEPSEWPDAAPSWWGPRCIANVQAYRFAGERLAGFQSRVEQALARASKLSPYLALAARFDDFNGAQSVAAILECLPAYEDWLRRYRILWFLPFADRRGNGIAKVPEFRAAAEAFFRAVPERPNRFDGWDSERASLDSQILNVLGQDVELLMLSPKKRQRIREALAAKK